jgi:hypothetical protein
MPKVYSILLSAYNKHYREAGYKPTRMEVSPAIYFTYHDELVANIRIGLPVEEDEEHINYVSPLYFKAAKIYLNNSLDGTRIITAHD